MHGAIDPIGPGAIAILVGFVVVWVGSLVVLIDSLRRPAVDYTGLREGRWFYAVPQGAYALAFAVNQVPWVQTSVPVLGTAVVLMLVPVIAHQVAYLLRVVFPTPARIEARMRAAGTGAAEGAGEDGEPRSGEGVDATDGDGDGPC